MTYPRAGAKAPGATGPLRSTLTAWTWIADHPQHRPDPVGYLSVDLYRTVLVDDRDL